MSHLNRIQPQIDGRAPFDAESSALFGFRWSDDWILDTSTGEAWFFRQ